VWCGQLETTDEFAGLGSIKPAAVPASLLVPAELLVPAADPIGVRLLRLMGWRDGQGVGPRRKRVRGQDGEPGDGDVDADDAPGGALYKDFKFAPKDVEMFEAQVKDDLFGLGFDPLASTPEFSGLLNSTSSALAKAQRKQHLSSRLSFGGSKNDGGCFARMPACTFLRACVPVWGAHEFASARPCRFASWFGQTPWARVSLSFWCISMRPMCVQMRSVCAT
jgi:hypothetical protein